MTTIQDVLDAIRAAGAADCWHLADELATEHSITACRMCLVAQRWHPSVKQHCGLPEIAVFFCQSCFEKYEEQRRAVRTITIYARSHGSDVTGNGTLQNPYATFARAQRDIPRSMSPGVKYAVDVTGITEEIA